MDNLIAKIEKGTVIVMDNISFHKSAYVRDLALQAGMVILYIPPYSPECNPVEHFFSVCKATMRKVQTYSAGGDNLIDVVNKTLATILQVHEFTKYFGPRTRETTATVIKLTHGIVDNL